MNAGVVLLVLHLSVDSYGLYDRSDYPGSRRRATVLIAIVLLVHQAERTSAFSSTSVNLCINVEHTIAITDYQASYVLVYSYWLRFFSPSIYLAVHLLILRTPLNLRHSVDGDSGLPQYFQALRRLAGLPLVILFRIKREKRRSTACSCSRWRKYIPDK